MYLPQGMTRYVAPAVTGIAVLVLFEARVGWSARFVLGWTGQVTKITATQMTVAFGGKTERFTLARGEQIGGDTYVVANLNQANEAVLARIAADYRQTKLQNEDVNLILGAVTRDRLVALDGDRLTALAASVTAAFGGALRATQESDCG